MASLMIDYTVSWRLTRAAVFAHGGALTQFVAKRPWAVIDTWHLKGKVKIRELRHWMRTYSPKSTSNDLWISFAELNGILIIDQNIQTYFCKVCHSNFKV